MIFVAGRDLQHLAAPPVPDPAKAEAGHLAVLEPKPRIDRPPARHPQDSGRGHDRPTANVGNRYAAPAEGICPRQPTDSNRVRAYPDLCDGRPGTSSVRDPEIA